MSRSSAPPDIGDLHDEQIVALLRSGAHAALLTAYFGDPAYRELSHLAKLAALRRNERGPLVYVLPGVMGSRLGAGDRESAELIWLHPAAISAGALLQLALPGPRPLQAVGIMLPGYLKLQLSLAIAGFMPVFHPFDWRCDIDLLARAFMREIECSGADQVFVIAHSMGGLVARAALAHDSKSRITKLIQLGAPNFGSYAPVQALRAVYPTVRKIAALDRQHSAEELSRTVFHTLPGLYQLLPSGLPPSGANDFFDVNTWPDDELRPDPTLLAQARQRRAELPEADERCFLIAGTGQETVTSAVLRDSMFEYTMRRDGDGTVPLSLARWPGARTWYVEENHGALMNNNMVLAAVDDILKSADTTRLQASAPPPDQGIARQVSERELRTEATRKVRWDSLSLDSRRRILDPVISPEFLDDAGGSGKSPLDGTIK